ncbi:S8 family serine peptidase [Bacillus sp. EAC]|uniref:S8 family serine peptidase n=1 Tax=Bacillus sp. EAC TaxID=1978338 RepID=UPI000B450047|nr:S8 family serine peptidase [Bacillus sp. EAC]
MRHRKLNTMITSMSLSTFMILSNTVPAFAVTGETAGTIRSNEISNQSKFDLNQAQQLQNLYLQKLRFDPKLLDSSNQLDLIVEFEVDPIQIQMMNHQKSGTSASVSTFSDDQQGSPVVTLESAKEAVNQTHSNFKSFVNSESKTLKDAGESNSIKIGREYSQVFNGLAVKLPSKAINDLLALPYVKSVFQNVKYAPIPASQSSDVLKSSTGDGKVSEKETNPNLLPIIRSNRSKGKSTSESSKVTASSRNSINPLTNPVAGPGPEGPQSGETAVLDWLKIHDLQNENITGKGVKVGVIDTGLDYNHPDLSGEYQGGKDFVDNDNDPMETVYSDWLAAKNANDNLPSDQKDPNFPTDYRNYITSHGTHVAGTIAGQSRNNSPFAVRGVAPDVQLYAYRVLGPHGGADEDVIRGIEQSYTDGCKVINLSLGSPVNDSLSSSAIAINNITDLGVTAVIAAGNSGPAVGTLGTPGAAAKAITVGAITYPKEVPLFDIHSYDENKQDSFSNINTRLVGRDFSESNTKLSGSTQYDMVDAGSGTPEWYDYLQSKNISVENKVIVVRRGAAPVNQLMMYAAENHVKAMILWNPTDNPVLIFDEQGFYPYYNGASNGTVYTLQISKNDGTNFYNAFKSGTIKTISVTNAGNYKMSGNTLADFSSTGPVTGSLAIKPDVVAPGVDVYSTAPYDIWEPDNTDYSKSYQLMSGTSMASPHVAGMAALILSAHPNYKPEDVKAVMMQTADPIDSGHSLFQIGSGKSDPYQAVHTDMLFKVKDYIQSRSSTDESSSSNIISVANTTSSFSFGYIARQEDGSVLKTGDLYITNNGSSAKTFDSSSVFFKDTLVKDGQDGGAEGANISLSEAASPATTLTSFTVPSGGTVHLIAKFTTPATAASGFYEAYINFVNSERPTETYRIPLAINIQSRGIDFRVERKAITLSGDKNFNPNTFALTPVAYAGVRVKSPIDPTYGLKLYVMDLEGKNYIGFIGAMNSSYFSLGNLATVSFLMNGTYNPYSSPISKDDPSLSSKLTQQSSRSVVAEEGGYVIQARALDASTGKLYEINSTVYVDNTPPTVQMDPGSVPGIYEIDPNGPLTDGALKWFSGKAYDSNVDYMKNVGHETLVPAPPVYDTDTKVSQSLGKIDGMLGDSNSAPFVNYTLGMNEDGTFKFGISKDDILNTDADPEKENYGTQFRIYPEDYSYAGNIETQGKYYYFVKKGNEYVVNRFARLETPGSTTLNGIDPAFLIDKTLISKDDQFKSTLSIKYPKNLVGAKFNIDKLPFAEILDIDFSAQYKTFLASKGITPDKRWIHQSEDINGDFIFNFEIPTDVQAQGILNSADTMSSGVEQEMPLLDIKYNVTNDAGFDTMWLVGSTLVPEIKTYSDGKTGMDRVPIFQDKFLHIKGGAYISGGIKPEGFQNHPTAQNAYGRATPITANESGVEIKFEDPNTGGITTVLPIAENPAESSTSMNTGIVENGLFVSNLPMQAGDKPYNIIMKMPGHFTYNGTLAVSTRGQYNYSAGGNYTVPSGVMLAGDVNGDDVIDMRDIEAECAAYNAYVSAPSTYTREADFNFDGGIDYTDFEYIVKNFGKVNSTAPNAAALAGTTALTTSEAISLTGFTTLPSGSNLAEFNKVVKPVPYMRTSDSTGFVNYGKVNPFQLFSVSYKTPDAFNASTVTQIDNADWRTALDGAGGQILIDGIDRKAATNVYNGVSGNSIVNKVVSGKGQYEFDPSLFTKAGVHTIVFKAPGYMDRSLKFRMLDGAGNFFTLLAPNNNNTIGKALTFSRADTTGSTSAHYRDIWKPNIKSITVTDPNNNVVENYTGNELVAIFNQVTPANETTFNFTIPAGVFSTSGDWKIVITADNFSSYNITQRINAFAAPTLTAESNRYFNDSNSNPISIGVGTTNDTLAWRDAITAVQIGSTTIAKADFATKNINVGDPGTPIMIDKSLITVPGNININVIATNYQTSTVNQPFYKKGVTLTKPTGTIYAGKDLVMTFTPGSTASDWINAVEASGNIKFATDIKTRVDIDESAGTLKIPYDLVRTDGDSAISRDVIVTAPGYADTFLNVTITPQPAPTLTLSAPAGTPQYGDTITYTINGDDNPLWRSSVLLASTSDQTIDNGDVTIQFASVKPFVTTSFINGKGIITIDGYATQSNTTAGNKTVMFQSPFFAPITIAQPFTQRTAPTPTLKPSGVGKPVILTLPNNVENMRWATALTSASGDIKVGGVSIKAATTLSSDANNIMLTLPGTAFPTTGNSTITLKAYCYPDTTVTQVIKSNSPVFASKIAYIQESTPIMISYEPDSAWLAAAPVVSMNDTVVDPSKYELSDSKLTLVDRTLFKELGDYKFTISAPGYIDSTFDVFVSDELAHLIAATTDINGSINPSGWVSVNDGTDQTFTITPKIGYEIDTLKVDGVNATATNNTYTMTNITTNHTIDVTFKIQKFTVIFDKQDGSVVESETADYNTTITTPPAPTRPGYAFLGWYQDPAGKTAWNFELEKVTEDTTIYAKWATGIENHGIYNTDVIISFNEATAKLDGKDFTSGTAVTSEGKHTLVVTDVIGNTTIVQFTIDKTSPIVTSVSNNGLYNHDVNIAFNEGTATLNGDAITNGTVVSKEGIYSLIVTDQVGNKTMMTFTIDKTAPNVTGVSNNGLYNHDVIITINEGTAKLNGDTISNGTAVSKEGIYSLIVTDQAGNISKVTFTIDKIAPHVTGVSNNGLYNHNVTVIFKEGTATLNGEGITSGTVVSKEGTNTLIVKDQAGNITTLTFTIDKTAPVVTGVSKNGLYNKGVTIKFNEGTATLNGKLFRSGISVFLNGTYTLLVKDRAGNTTTVKFTIDTKSPKAPIVDKVSSKTTKVSGKAESGSTIVFKVGTKIIGTGKADKFGKFSVSILKQRAGTIIYGTAKDKAGNVSIATKVSVKK